MNPVLPPEMITRLDDAAKDFLGLLKGYEDAYLATPYPGYLQLLPTHTVIPVDGVSMPPDNLTTKPTDEQFAPTDLGWAFGPLPFSGEVHSMQRDALRGYTAVMKMRDGAGNLFVRTDEITAGGTITAPWAFVNESPITAAT